MPAPSAARVLDRYLHAAQLPEQDEGAFVVQYLPRHAAVVATIAAKMHKAIDEYRSAGIPVRDKFLLTLTGKGAGSSDLAAYYPGSNPPTFTVAPKAFNRPDLVHTFIHELGHYVHEHVVPGGRTNAEISSRYEWAMGRVTAPAPKKGEPFEFVYRGSGLSYSRTNRGYPVTGQIVGKGRGKDLRVQILKYPAELLEDPIVSAGFRDVDAHGNKIPSRKPIIMELPMEKLRDTGRDTVKDGPQYESQQHDWVPTSYAKKDAAEWFAEMITTFVLGHLAKEPTEWLRSVVKTGKA